VSKEHRGVEAEVDEVKDERGLHHGARAGLGLVERVGVHVGIDRAADARHVRRLSEVVALYAKINKRTRRDQDKAHTRDSSRARARDGKRRV
jgi:hypothetical protein